MQFTSWVVSCDFLDFWVFFVFKRSDIEVHRFQRKIRWGTCHFICRQELDKGLRHCLFVHLRAFRYAFVSIVTAAPALWANDLHEAICWPVFCRWGANFVFQNRRLCLQTISVTIIHICVYIAPGDTDSWESMRYAKASSEDLCRLARGDSLESRKFDLLILESLRKRKFTFKSERQWQMHYRRQPYRNRHSWSLQLERRKNSRCSCSANGYAAHDECLPLQSLQNLARLQMHNEEIKNNTPRHRAPRMLLF